MGYCYRQRENSITHSKTLSNIEMLFINIKKCIAYKEKKDVEDLRIQAYMEYVSYQYGTLLYTINTLDNPVRIEQINKVQLYKNLLKYSQNRKVKILYIIYKTVGFICLNNIIYIYIRLRTKIGR